MEWGMESLKIGLIHLNVIHNRPDKNKEELLRLNRKAAEAGAKIILNTEMAISGYSFQSRDEIAAAAESPDGEFADALAEITTRYGAYIINSCAERDDKTNIYYNAATAFSPEGKAVCRYRKNSAESRWACPGNPDEENTFETPWGRVGLLICSDTYFSALARMTTLRNADIILVPANWPEGTLSPGLLWKTRAYENGVYVVACNRSGNDRTMTFENAFSCVYAPSGETLLRSQSEDSRIFYVSLPLENGKLINLRRDRLQSRTPERYVPMYLNMQHAGDLTSWYGLPKPGDFRVAALAMPTEQVFSGSVVETMLVGAAMKENDLAVLPFGIAHSIEEAERKITGIAVRLGVDICAGVHKNPSDITCVMIFADASGRTVRYPVSPADKNEKLRIVDTRSVRILLASVDELLHPETALAAAKLGCDLAVSSTTTGFDGMMRQTITARSIDQIYIAVAGNGCAFISEPPESHYPWKEIGADSGGMCIMPLDFTKSRKKRFFDRLDFDLLLRRQENV